MRFRFFLRRFPVSYWACALGLTVVTGLCVARFAGAAEASAARYGPLVRVPVVARPVDAGAVIGAGDVSVRLVPRTLVPGDGAVARGRSWLGRAALVPLVPGEVVLARRLAPDGLQGVTALLPPGARALAIPVGPGTPPLDRGEHVDVLASFEPSPAPDAGPPTFPVALGAPVLAVAGDAGGGEKSVTVAVGADEAPRVAFAITHGAVTLALVAPASPSSSVHGAVR